MVTGKLVQRALHEAASLPLSLSSSRDLHRERSRLFVEAIASQFRTLFTNSPDIAVLSKHYDRNRPRFGLNELLFDVLVCRTATTVCASSNERLTYVTEGIWAVESEFARDSREALFDFNKLVLASSRDVLFIGPRVADEDAFLKPLAAPAASCSGKVHVVLVPHPAEWGQTTPLTVRAFSWEAQQWSVEGT